MIFWDDQAEVPTLIKLRGCEENGFGDAGFGCILGLNARGEIAYMPGTMEQAVEREKLTWEAFGFSCRVLDEVEDGMGLLLAQDFIEGTAPTEKEIHAYMTRQGWEWQRTNRSVSPTLCHYAWRKGSLGAFDANETNLIKSTLDGAIYPIDLIVWHWPE